jgi:hypothetical protein
MNFITDHLGAFSARNVSLIVSRGTPTLQPGLLLSRNVFGSGLQLSALGRPVSSPRATHAPLRQQLKEVARAKAMHGFRHHENITVGY